MKKYIALIAVVIALGGGTFLTQKWFIESSAPAGPSSLPTSVTLTATTTSTVLDVMHTLAAEGSLSFSGRDFPSLGFFVEEINGHKGAGGYYWILHINGTPSQKGASQAVISPEDVVEWRYEEGY
jgi:hypothetical protein